LGPGITYAIKLFNNTKVNLVCNTNITIGKLLKQRKQTIINVNVTVYVIS